MSPSITTTTTTTTSKRWEMMYWLCAGISINYFNRVVASIAAPAMYKSLEWSEQQRGMFLSAFYWGYTVGQLPFSLLAQRYGAKYIFALSIFFPTLLSAITPAICAYCSFASLLVVRTLTGFTSAACFPSVYNFFPFWVPPHETTSMIPTVYAGMYIGEIVTFALGGYIMNIDIDIAGHHLTGWPMLYYCCGCLGCVFVPLWLWNTYETPASHPGMAADELQLFQNAQKKPRKKSDILYSALTNNDNDDYNNNDNSSTNPLTQSLVSFRDEEGHRLPATEMQQQHQHQHQESRAVSLDYVALEATCSQDYSSRLLSNGNDENNDDNSNNHGHGSSNSKLNTPWLAFLTTPASLTLVAACWANGWTGFLLLSELPSFLKDRYNVDIDNATLFCVLPYTGLLLSTFGFSAFFRYLQEQRHVETRTIRQLAQLTCFWGGGLCLLLCAYVGDNIAAVVSLIVLTQVFGGAANSGLGCSFLDLAPRFSGNYHSLGNLVQSIAGLAGPLVVADMVTAFGYTTGWTYVLALTTIMSVLASLLWMMFQSSTIHPVLNAPAKGYCL